MSASPHPRNLIPIVLLALVFLLPSSALAQSDKAPLQVIYPQTQDGETKRSFAYQLLQLSLEKSGHPFSLSLSTEKRSEAQAREQLLKQHSGIHVIWAETSSMMEQKLRPIPIPTHGGLSGYRLFVIHREMQPRLSGVRDMERLKTLTAGIPSGGSEVEIFQKAGLQVRSEPLDELYRLVAKGRVHYVPLRINTIYSVVKQRRQTIPQLAVDKKLLLIYPSASFFFVHPQNEPLHAAILAGLSKAHEDGSFIRLFQNHPSTANSTRRAHIWNRRALRIANPQMSDAVQNIPERYLFNDQWLAKLQHPAR
ncbi:MAG: hypothetical protein HQL53_09605 [Magnetococcales bacterium]|nr:hypothetical protein [Magnetococcales bacterium]